ncbi:MAG: inositol-3-phosphate synthase [Microthrixaceae bacterium]|nr:inositol-3-phosphate synthase [Microthrixaceae bacterium]
MGAVASTAYAGVIAVRKGLAVPVGSLTQMAHIRLGRREEGRNPMIREFVPLAELEDLVFGGWDPISPTPSKQRAPRGSWRNTIWRRSPRSSKAWSPCRRCSTSVG